MNKHRQKKLTEPESTALTESGSAPASNLGTQKPQAVRGRIMYIERKAGNLTGEARIGRVTFSQTGQTLYYQGREFRSLKGNGFKANYFEIGSGEDYWISGPKRRGGDALYRTNIKTAIDDDVREEYWCEIRCQPERIEERFTT